MKYNLVRIGSVLMIVGVILIMGFLVKPAHKPVIPAGNGFAVVELFTSEGCSSCPAADAEVEKISALHPDNVYVLGFHVDYWNRLGWKDEFSDAAFSDRQRGYADHFNLSGVYTPQVVVNGKEELVGSDAPKLEKSVNIEINKLVNHAIELSAVATGKTVQVNYKLEAPGNTAVNIALVQIAAATSVKRGENEGRTLHHINIVRDFKTISNTGQTGNANLAIPNGLDAKACKVIVYVQHSDTREITAVATSLIK